MYFEKSFHGCEKVSYYRRVRANLLLLKQTTLFYYF